MRFIFKRSVYISNLFLLLLAPHFAITCAAQVSSSSTSDVPNSRATLRTIDASIPDDPATVALVAPYGVKVHALDNIIGTLTVELKKSGIGGGTLGNFVTDAMRRRASLQMKHPVLLAITNSGGLRRNTIAPGELRARDVYELLPFENALVTIDLTGAQLLEFLGVIVSHGDAQSGAQVVYRRTADEHNEFVNATFATADGRRQEIVPTEVYTIVTIDYLVKRGGDYSVLQEGANMRPLNLTIRDALLDDIKTETAAHRQLQSTLDGRFRAVEGTTGDGK